MGQLGWETTVTHECIVQGVTAGMGVTIKPGNIDNTGWSWRMQWSRRGTPVLVQEGSCAPLGDHDLQVDLSFSSEDSNLFPKDRLVGMLTVLKGDELQVPLIVHLEVK